MGKGAMKLSETAFKLAFFGMKRDAEDIIDYLAIRSSILGLLVLGTMLALLVGRAAGPGIGLAAGIALYGISMRICSVMIVRSHHN
jgi:hypothetical protein